MLIHYATLTELARRLSGRLENAVVAEVYSQTRNELIVAFAGDEQTPALRISVEPHRNFVYLLQDAKRARRNSIDLFPSVPGRSAVSFTAAVHDRILFLHLSDGMTMAVTLFGSAANVLLLDDSRTIVDAFVHAKDLVGSAFTTKTLESPGRFLEGTAGEFLSAVRSTGRATVQEALRSMFPSLGKILIEEALFRAGIETGFPSDSVTDEQSETLRRVLKSMYDGLQNPVPRIYFRSHSPVAFSIVPLEHFKDLRCEEYEDINEAMRVYAAGTARDEHFENEYRTLKQKLRAEVAKMERSVGKIRGDLEHADRAAAYERYGTILLAHPDGKKRNEKSIELADPLTGEPVVIPLEPALTLAKNATRYFEKAKKAKAGRRESQERLGRFEKSLTDFRLLEAELAKCSTSEELKEFMQVHGMIENEKAEKQVPFRIFHVVGGFEVWAGKSSRNNDELTLHYAKPDDLWFHARGSGGSHVILRAGTGNGEPSKEAREQAAAIAAYYSKQKNAKYVPVAMAEKKYVRKPRGAAPGSVIMEREKIIMVKPGLPGKSGE